MTIKAHPEQFDVINTGCPRLHPRGKGNVRKGTFSLS